jgi:oxygen-independent coproporphyrinogen-3 oxidase
MPDHDRGAYLMSNDSAAKWADLASRDVAFAGASAALGRLGLPAVLPALHAEGLGIRRAVLGGSHSVAIYPPIDSLHPVEAGTVLETIAFGHDTSLYVHIPFCETRCTFCHYTVQHYTGQGQGNASRTSDSDVARYLDALACELALWGERLARSGTAVSSIYIGGGTPLVLEPAALHALMRTIGACFEIVPGAEICIEGSPLTITAPGGADKLGYLKERGVTRLSFGVQSFDDAVLKFAGRGYKRDVAIQAAQIAAAQFDNWNLDLIQGLYKGSPAETWDNLQVIAQLQPAHLTWYHGRFADRPQGDWYQSAARHDDFEDEIDTLIGRMLIWQEMAALGYAQCDGNRFVRAQRFADPFKKIRTSSSRDLLGVGVASYSHVGARAGQQACRGYEFRNETGIRRYTERMLGGALPIASGRAIDDEELLAMSYATGLRGGRIETGLLRAIGDARPQMSAHYRALAARLAALGVLDAYAADDGAAGLRLSSLGRLFEDETLALFFSPAVKRALAAGLAPQDTAIPVHFIPGAAAKGAQPAAKAAPASS